MDRSENMTTEAGKPQAGQQGTHQRPAPKAPPKKETKR